MSGHQSPVVSDLARPIGSAPMVFVGGPFTRLIDPVTGLLAAEHRENYSSLISHFVDRGFDVDNAHRREGWGAQLMKPDECTRLDHLAVRKAVLFVAYPGDPVSPGTLVEMGWVSAMGKPMVLLVERGTELPALVAGLHTVSPVRYLTVDSGRFDPAALDDCVRELIGWTTSTTADVANLAVGAEPAAIA